jgi:alpha-D-ribose 1-methylphosphonate 5-triphosphate synthase subunit PhnL
VILARLMLPLELVSSLNVEVDRRRIYHATATKGRSNHMTRLYVRYEPQEGKCLVGIRYTKVATGPEILAHRSVIFANGSRRAQEGTLWRC